MPIYNPITYDYQPSLAAAIVGVVFTTIFVCHQSVSYVWLKAWFFYLMVLCTILELTGFSARLSHITHPSQNSLAYLSTLLITNTPSLIAAALHMTFGRVLSYSFSTYDLHWQAFLVPVRAVTTIFVSLDLMTLCTQLIGGALICAAFDPTSDPTSDDLKLLTHGLDIMKWSSIAQIIYFSIFIFITVRFFTLKQVRDQEFEEKDCNPGALVLVISISQTLLILREIYQVTEMSAALDGTAVYSRSHEWVFWVVHALPIFLIFTAFGIVHPGRCLPSSSTRLYLDILNNKITRNSSVDLSTNAGSSPRIHESLQKPLPPLPPPRISPPDEHRRSRRVQFLRRLTGESWPLPPVRSPENNEVSPYESPKSYRAWVHGAL